MEKSIRHTIIQKSVFGVFLQVSGVSQGKCYENDVPAGFMQRTVIN